MKQIILYGAGKNGRRIYEFLKYQGLSDEVFAFCDKNASSITTVYDKKVINYEAAKKRNLPFLISVSQKNRSVYADILNHLKTDFLVYYEDVVEYEVRHLGRSRAETYRDYCAFWHIKDMDDYFRDAEQDAAMDVFWSSDSIFFRMFQQLSLENVVELACGRGRHVPRYIEAAGEITLVDILEKNIEIVKDRFSRYKKIHYYINNGYDLSELSDGFYSALFTYDAMVHFELLDIYNYLRETYRILKSGGMALFHHSNDATDYRNSFQNGTNSGGRSFMSKMLFAHLAYRAGFEIVEQHVIDWSEPQMDCLSLVRKK